MGATLLCVVAWEYTVSDLVHCLGSRILLTGSDCKSWTLQTALAEMQANAQVYEAHFLGSHGLAAFGGAGPVNAKLHDQSHLHAIGQLTPGEWNLYTGDGDLAPYERRKLEARIALDPPEMSAEELHQGFAGLLARVEPEERFKKRREHHRRDGA